MLKNIKSKDAIVSEKLAQAQAEVRLERNRMLSETDYEVLQYLEKGIVIPAELKAYRQSLRDLPSTDQFPSVSVSGEVVKGQLPKRNK